ncbi:MAG: chromate transporter, partial [Thermoguttaceae bacterium]|nr:chromate transporter [Thermoguttaceae bacterium]
MTRRNWVTREQFLDLLGATHLIPGPNALEMAAHLGYLRAGLRGLLVASVAFTLPAAAISGVLGWAYVRYGALPEIAPFLQGTKPAVLAVVFAAVWRLGRTALAGYATATIGVLVAAASLAGANEILALLGGSLIGALVLRRRDSRAPDKKALVAVAAAAGTAPQTARAAVAVLASAAAGAATSVALWQIGLFFLKIGAVLYGSGYVLIAYLEGGLVRDYG